MMSSTPRNGKTEKTDKFLKIYSLTRLDLEEIENMKRQIMSNEIVH